MVLPVIVAEHIFIPLIAGSQDNQLHILAAYLIHDSLNQIQPLLVCEAGYNSHHKLFLINRKPQLLLQSFLVLPFFPAEILCIVILSNITVCLRVKFTVVDSIYDSP